MMIKEEDMRAKEVAVEAEEEVEKEVRFRMLVIQILQLWITAQLVTISAERLQLLLSHTTFHVRHCS
jgi:hypothetical protein